MSSSPPHENHLMVPPPQRQRCLLCPAAKEAAKGAGTRAGSKSVPHQPQVYNPSLNSTSPAGLVLNQVGLGSRWQQRGEHFSSLHRNK